MNFTQFVRLVGFMILFGGLAMGLWEVAKLWFAVITSDASRRPGLKAAFMARMLIAIAVFVVGWLLLSFVPPS